MDKSRFNYGRRQTLKAIGVAGGSIVLPAWVVNAQATQWEEQQRDGNLRPSRTDLSVSFSDSFHAGAQLISLSNNSSQDMTLRHIYPGIVITAGKSYDLNDLLQGEQVTLRAGSTQVYRISPTSDTPSEKTFPHSTQGGHAIKVSTVERAFNKAYAVSTTRYCLA